MMCRRRTVDCSEPPRIIIVVTNQRGAVKRGTGRDENIEQPSASAWIMA